ncbi:hypothetical protein XH94_28600 [Bradyrhizobium zhanjiangense]|uniref:Uncharacterized protein n=1 Tax=Bradyrhizobium zhanjiangense TaxID=1325107 RepID=A0A4V1L2T7_9BRAD|nr:hypothetical protein XH94_28600 [Bradyrhizobium zhanjiangense]
MRATSESALDQLKAEVPTIEVQERKSQIRESLPLHWFSYWFSLLNHEDVECFCRNASLVVCFVNDAGFIVIGLSRRIGLGLTALFSTDDLAFEHGRVFVAGMGMEAGARARRPLDDQGDNFLVRLPRQRLLLQWSHFQLWRLLCESDRIHHDDCDQRNRRQNMSELH